MVCIRSPTGCHTAPEQGEAMEAPQDGTPDYTLLDGPAFLEALGDDAMKWATAFCQTMHKQKWEIDESLMVGWFANAIEHSSDVRHRRGQPATQPALRASAQPTPPALTYVLQEMGRHHHADCKHWLDVPQGECNCGVAEAINQYKRALAGDATPPAEVTE